MGTKKVTYVTPALERYGSISELTAAGSGGDPEGAGPAGTIFGVGGSGAGAGRPGAPMAGGGDPSARRS